MKALTLTASGLTSGHLQDATQHASASIHRTEETTGQSNLCSRACSISSTARRWTRGAVCLAVATLATAGFLLGFILPSIPLILGCGLAALLAVAASDSDNPEESITENHQHDD